MDSNNRLLFDSDSEDEDKCIEDFQFKRRKIKRSPSPTLTLRDPRTRAIPNVHTSRITHRNHSSSENGCGDSEFIGKSLDALIQKQVLHSLTPPHPPSQGISTVLSAICSTDIPKVDLTDPKVLKRQNKPIIEIPSKVKSRISPDAATQDSIAVKILVNNPLETRQAHRGREGLSTLNRSAALVKSDELSAETKKDTVAQKKKMARAKFEADAKQPRCKDEICEPFEKITWDFFKEVIRIEETVEWIPSEPIEPLDLSLLTSWRKIVQRVDPSETIGTKFGGNNLHNQLAETRKTLANWNKHFLLNARLRSNPFETIRYAFFMNRAALKIANLDAILSFGLTNPKFPSGAQMVGDTELFYFADVCAGPGGFSEYVLWRKQWEAKGFGFTLRNCDCDFNLQCFLAGSPESFEVSYGVKGDGDVLDPANVDHFVRYVNENTDGKGVHLMMADGGIEVDDKNNQENACKGLYLAQFLVALGIVQEGGNFVCKLFDLTTPFSLGLIYLVYCSFEEIGIHKPHSSRQANAERYIICKRKHSKQHTQGVFQYLSKCHEMLWNYNKNKKPGISPLDILELVPMSILTKKDSKFYEYIKQSNNALATKQILALQKMIIYCKDQSLEEIRQKDCRQVCLRYWEIPDLNRRIFNSIDSYEIPIEQFNLIRKDYKTALLDSRPKNLTKHMINEVFKSPFDWRFIVLGTGPVLQSRAFFYAMGRDRVVRFHGNVWREIQFNLSLTKDTCVYAELVVEVSLDLSVTKAAFHIIDGFILGGKDIRNLHYTQRHEMCVKFAKAMNKPGTPEAVPVRAKSITRLEHISTIFEKITTPEMSDDKAPVTGVRTRLFPTDSSTSTSPTKFFHPTGLLFLRITREPWMMAYSREAGRKYWYNCQTKESSFNCPETAISNFKNTAETFVAWNWDKDTQIDIINTIVANPATELTDKVHPKQLIDHVDKFLAHVVAPTTQNT